MAKWRIVYKRSMHDYVNRGFGKRDGFAFFNDDYLEDDYAAVLSYKEDNDPHWYIFSRIMKWKYCNEYVLIDSEGKNFLEPPHSALGERFFTMYLKDNNPSPYEFCCMINARKDLLEIYKKLQRK